MSTVRQHGFVFETALEVCLRERRRRRRRGWVRAADELAARQATSLFHYKIIIFSIGNQDFQ